MDELESLHEHTPFEDAKDPDDETRELYCNEKLPRENESVSTHLCIKIIIQ